MTVSYVRSPSFFSHNTFTDLNQASPQHSPLASCASLDPTTSPVVGFSSPRSASRAFGTPSPAAGSSSSPHKQQLLASSASAPIPLAQLAEANSIVVPNDCMEAGLSLRPSPLLLSHDFESEPHTSDTEGPRTSYDSDPLEDLESSNSRYQSLLTGDIDLDRFVYRRPYVDRAFYHSNRRSQLIFEQKIYQQRSSAQSQQDAAQTASTSTSPTRQLKARRPGTAPQRASPSAHTPGSAPGRLDFASRGLVTTSSGLRELTTGASAQRASNRASWIRRTREFEALSDSHHHSNTSTALEPAASIAASIAASRRHSSFLAGDFRSATLMPVLASNSFDPHLHRANKRRSGIFDKPAKASSTSNLSTSPVLVAASALAGAKSSKRNSMLSTDSSATSSSKGGRRSIENAEFEGDDAHQQAQSSVSSGCGHDDTPATKSATWKADTDRVGQDKVAEVFTTPRTSADHDTATDSKLVESVKVPVTVVDETLLTKPLPDPPSQDNSLLTTPTELEAPLEASTDSATDPELVAAPATSSAILSPVQTAVLPPTPTAPEWTPSAIDPVSPTSSPVKTFRSLNTDGFRRNSQASLEVRSPGNPASPFSTLANPSGKANGNNHLLASASRRDSSASIASAASSTSTYRIRTKHVPSDADELSPQDSPATQDVPLPEVSTYSNAEKDDVCTVRHTRTPSGSDFMRTAQEAASAHMLANDKRPSTAVFSTATSDQEGLAVGRQLHGSASTRDFSTNNTLGLGTPPSTAEGAAPTTAESRTPSRATIKRPTTAPVSSASQFRSADDAANNAMMEVEGMQFVLGKQERKGKAPQEATSPSIPNAVRFIQDQRVGSNSGETASPSKRDSLLDKRKSASIKDSTRSDGASAKTSSLNASSGRSGAGGEAAGINSAGGWGLEQELKIVDRVRDPQGSAEPKPRPASMDKSKKSQEASAAKAQLKNSMLMNIINEDESDEVKAAAREAGIPEGSYAIHPPSMLQIFEASQCLVYNQKGEEVIFGDLFKKRRTLVCFLRHWWCGFCQQFARSIRNIDPLPLKKANLDFIIVGQGDWHVIKAYREVMQVPYPMFADPKRNIYRALGMTLRTNDASPVCARPDYANMGMTKGILVAIKKGLFDMPIRNPGDMKLLGGDFILGPGLQCSFTHRMTTADGHMDIPRILAQAGCDLSLRTPKPKMTVDEKDARAAMLAGGNQNRPRSLGRSRGKKSNKPDPAMLDQSLGSANGHSATGANGTGSTNSRSNRLSLWGRFPGRFSISQVSLPTSGSVVDLNADFVPSRGLSAGPRSASAMRKISYDGRVRDSFETQQTDIEFESRATSIDTRWRPSDVSASTGLSSLHKAQSMSELRRRFEMSSMSSLGGFRNRNRQEPSAAKLSLESHLAMPGSGGRNDLRHSASSTSLCGAKANANGNDGASGAATATQQSTSAQNGSKPLSVFRNNVISRSNGVTSPAPAGLDIAAAGEESTDGAINATAGDKTMVEDDTNKVTAPPKSMAELAAPGSFLMDLDVYDSIFRQPSQKNPTNGKQNFCSVNAGLFPSAFSDSSFTEEAADADSDTDPSMSATQSPVRSQRTSASNSFYSFKTFHGKKFRGKTFRGKTNLEHLPEEADEEESDADDEEEENDEPIQFEDGRSGLS
ncbi:hypothetical protein NDA12_004915 [Ustilago hordei]|nr:hypothetical protein NDA15_000336 [Ustilago hordei]KAJ1577294.1 hypothetical protein NDA12_004915 [Ustilago hordei]